MRLTDFIRVAAFALGAATFGVAQAADISGAGATFPFPIYAKWADSYKKDTGNGLNYQSIGSGAGIKQIKARTVTFGATDAPLEPKELEKAGLAQWPMVMGGIVAVVNLPGVKPGEIIIDGPTLAQIYLGAITNWRRRLTGRAASAPRAMTASPTMSRRPRVQSAMSNSRTRIRTS
jgi:phosphate transport system substrate-binding protein